MAYQTSNLSVLAYDNNFTAWHFIDKETPIEDIVDLEKNYFGSAHSMLRVDDLIIINTANFVGTVWVTENNDSKVVVALQKML